MLASEGHDELFETFPSLKQNGSIPRSSLREALCLLGFSLAGYEVRDLENQMLPTGSSEITLEILTQIRNKVREAKNTGAMYKPTEKSEKSKEDLKTYKATEEDRCTAVHTVSLSEERGFARWLNRSLKNDEECNKTYLPISPNDLYTKCADGFLLCKLINKSVKDTIDERILNRGTALKSVFKRNENLVLAVTSAEAIGCCVVNIGPRDIAEGTKHIVLGLIWQIIRIGLLSLVNLTHRAELAVLLHDWETLDDLRQLSPEEILIRWVNYQMGKAGQNKRIKNFREDIMDSEAYAYLLNQIAPSEFKSQLTTPEGVLQSTDKMARAEKVLTNADLLDVHDFLEAEDIAKANAKGTNREKLNLAFVANLFNNYPALEMPEEDFDIIEETLEELTYRNWMNSMGVTPFVKDLYSDLRNGLVLLQLFDVLKPGIVNWTMVSRQFDHKKRLFQMQDNCTHAVDCAKRYQLSVVNLCGNDICTGERKLTLGLCFQMMRAYTIKLLSQLREAGDPKIEDKDIVAWANEKLHNGEQISGFKDPKIATAKPVLDLIEAICPNAVDYKLVSGDAEKDAKLAISTARKTGARVYALPQHLTSLNQKMIMTVYACLMICDYQKRKAGG